MISRYKFHSVSLHTTGSMSPSFLKQQTWALEASLIRVIYSSYMLCEGKICLKEGSDGPYVFPIIIEKISLQKQKQKSVGINKNGDWTLWELENIKVDDYMYLFYSSVCICVYMICYPRARQSGNTGSSALRNDLYEEFSGWCRDYLWTEVICSGESPSESRIIRAPRLYDHFLCVRECVH